MFLILIAFWSILLQFSRGFGKHQGIQDGGYKMASIGEHYVIRTSYDVTISYRHPQRKDFRTSYLFYKFRCNSLNILGITEGGGETESTRPRG